MPDTGGVPQYEAVVKELKLVREHGLGALRRLQLPALHRAASAAELATSDIEPDPSAVEDMIRKAVDRLGGGDFEEMAQYTFGLIGGTKYEPPYERRRQAAGVRNISTETFRKTHEKEVIAQAAEGVLALARDGAMRRANLQMQQRHPADSRLAVAWVERFEAYYRIWTPVYALAADLGAALEVYKHDPAERPPGRSNGDEPYDPVAEAEGYARRALYWYAKFLLEVKRFMARHGGLWLFSDTERESDIRDSIYRIGWHTPMSEENDSWLRGILATSQLEEPKPFFAQLRSTSAGDTVHAIWQEFVLEGHRAEVGGSEPNSQVHSTIQACDDYTEWTDAEWLRIADWYAPGAAMPRGVDASGLYRTLRGNEAAGRSRAEDS